jgi:hypothetical protein
LPATTTDVVTEEMYDGGDEQLLASSTNVLSRVSKRTTASFNERHQTSKVPIYARPSFSFANPLRRLNSKNKYCFSYFNFLYSSGLLKPAQSPSTPKLNGKNILKSSFLL